MISYHFATQNSFLTENSMISVAVFLVQNFGVISQS